MSTDQTVSTAEHTSLSGMALAGAAFALLTAMDTIFKLIAGGGHPAYQILLINAFFALIPILIWTSLNGGLGRLRTLRAAQHLARGSASVTSAFAAIYAYSRLPLTDFYAIVFAGPLIVTAMSAFWLGEKVDTARWVAIASGFSGILIIAHPFSGGGDDLDMVRTELGRFAALISVFCYALSVVMIRSMRAGENNLTFSFYGYVACILIAAACMLLRGPGAALHVADILHLGLAGILAGIASICLMTAYHRTPVALVAPFQYTQILWGAVAGYFFWNHLPDMRLIAGAAVVAVSGMFVIYREMRAR